MDIEKMKAAALAATPGPWEQSNKKIPYVFAIGTNKSEHEYLMHKMPIGAEASDYHPDTRKRWLNDAAYIAAANPAAVLELIAEVERLRENDKRYRFLRDHPIGNLWAADGCEDDIRTIVDIDDASIDAAIGEMESKQ